MPRFLTTPRASWPWLARRRDSTTSTSTPAPQGTFRLISLKGETKFLAVITATAELTISLILEALRRTGRAHRTVVDEGSWERDRFRGLQLRGRVLGIVGLGRLGTMVAGYAQAFHMPVLFFDPRADEDLAPPCFVRRAPFEELLAASDIVSLHANYTHESRGFFDDRAFRPHALDGHVREHCPRRVG